VAEHEQHSGISAEEFARDYPALAAEIDRIPAAAAAAAAENHTPAGRRGHRPTGRLLVTLGLAGAGFVLIVTLGISPWWLVVPAGYVGSVAPEATRLIRAIPGRSMSGTPHRHDARDPR
jgi:hypothetical protein